MPLPDVRLLRHKDQRAAKGLSPYELWRDNRPQFEWYQSTQRLGNRKKLDVPYWVSFVGTPSDETLFVGAYGVKYQGVLDHDSQKALTNDLQPAGSCDVYELTPQHEFADLDGKLLVDWGPGKRSWIQRADRQDKPITELRAEFKEPCFPGYLHFVSPLSMLDRIPPGWVVALQSCNGVYLLTCPKTKEQYVGFATGKAGFWGRWQDYVLSGHGGDLALRTRDPSDYQVSILEVAGTAASIREIIEMETRWKSKLQSREMGLNRN